MFLICGLGNPGKKYLDTRHNIGFIFVEKLIYDYDFVLLKKDNKKELYKGKIGKNICIILKPLSFINCSGPVVSETLNYYKIKSKKLFVVHDDLDLANAKIKIKIGGGNAGHNGLESIDRQIGNDYYRLRIGISHPANKQLVSSYVLKKFTKTEINNINIKLDLLSKNFELIFTNINLLLNNIKEKKI